METKKELVEDIAFKFAKDELLTVMKNKEQTAEKVFDVFNVTKKEWDTWFKEITSNNVILSSASKTKILAEILEKSQSLTEFCSKIIIYNGFREKIIKYSENPEMLLFEFFKNLLGK